MLILVEILFVALLAIAVSRFAPQPWRGRILNVLKAWVTVRAFWLLLDHQVKMDPAQIEALHLGGQVPKDATHVAAWRLIVAQIALIELGPFLAFCGAAAGIKFIGILASMYRWLVLLRGQGIEFPFRHIFGSFLIGRFIGTFLPSTAGLDGYKLYDAARFSGKSVEVTATTAIEKVMGVFGIFLSFLVALPFGIKIFGDNGPMIAAITVPLSLGLIGALLTVLWFPGLVQWLLLRLPIPGKARLEGIVMRVAHSASAYRDKKMLVLFALGLSFVVHFTTAAMYYFTALAAGAVDPEFWPIVFGSSIQIFATVVSPFTIAGEGIREAAQYVLLHKEIGAAASIVSAALGFWAAEALTLFGGFFWWLRAADYKPAYCRVDGVQVNYEEAARAAVSLETDEDRARHAARPASDVPSLAARVGAAAYTGLGAGIIAGLGIGVIETLVIAREGLGADHQVLWYGPFAYALLLGLGGLVGGAALGVLPMERREIRGWTASLVLLALGVVPALMIAMFRIRRDVYHEQMPPLLVLAGLLGIASVVALTLFLVGPRVLGGGIGRAFGAIPALLLGVLVVGGGAVAGRALYPSAPVPPTPPAVPAALADKPNLLLIVIDTLRADALSCYGGSVDAKNICGIAEQGGTLFSAFSHASWTKPSFASILTSTLPSTHNTMSKTATLPQDLVMVSEALQQHGYATGGIVANINLAPSFGFQQGYDEYTYLSPDYLFGADESSSKLIFYQIGRKVALKLKPGHRVADYYQDATTVTRVADDWLTRHKDSRFFLLLHYMDPHDPYFP
ncbi:MAG: sulfatase-like hydrolase/transferase, partial [Proteobacteria bacterium]|nr:sulfatase-like hydrolase/transferase [Pseudomonadota bacterium]